MKPYLRETIKTYNKIAYEYQQIRSQAIPIKELEHFSQLINGVDGKSILDAGMGPGRDAKWFSSKGANIYGVDLATTFVDIASKEVPLGKFCKMDILNLNFKDHFFDGIWCCAVLSHLKSSDVSQALSEFYRILKQHGILFIAVKKGHGEQILNEHEFSGSPKRFMTYFNKSEVKNLLLQSQFQIEDIYYFNELERFGGNHRNIDFIFCFARK